MYDTTNFYLNEGDAGNVDLMAEVPQYLDSYKDETTKAGNVSIWGKSQDYNIKITDYGISVSKGSLAKYLNGTNLQTLTRDEAKQSIEKISDTLHLPMDMATVQRLDVGTNIITTYPPEVYFNHLGQYKRSNRQPQNRGLYYSATNEQLALYDKIAQQKKKQIPIPAEYEGKNLLRYEIRFLHRLPKVFNVDRVTGAMLYDERFYSEAINRWQQAYENIYKINDIEVNFDRVQSVPDLKRLGLLSYIEQAGEVQMYQQIKEAQQRGQISSIQASRLREAIKRSCKPEDGLTRVNDCINELSQKINDAAVQYK